ncbi:MAG: hypothetical protein C5B51_12290 [Terriglobia bacterium]|nr:MAG: hypothetical protein C5B51_12290 [Terriglobia bacterium]
MSRPRRQQAIRSAPKATEPKVTFIERLRPLWKEHGKWLLALWFAVLLAYSNSFRAGLVYDNSIILQKDARIQEVTARNIQLIFNQEYWYNNATTGLYRPLTTLSYLFNYAVLGNGSNGAGYHWVNFLLHSLNAALVYALGVILFGGIAPALALAAVWALHPVLTESVTNIVGRADLLAALGVLAGLLCHILSAPATGRQKLYWRAGLTAAGTIAFFSKESGAVLPALMLVYDLAWSKRAMWRERAGHYLLLAVPGLIYLALRINMQAQIPYALIPFGDNPLSGAGFLTATLTAIKVLGKYLWLLVWPRRLSADYSYNAVPLFSWHLGMWEDQKALIALAVCLAAAGLALYSYRRQNKVFFFLAWFFVAMAPTSNLVILNGTIMAERFLYLPALGIVGCLVVAVEAAGRRWDSRLGWATLAVICLACAGRTFARNFDWRTERSLWTSVVNANPNSFKAHWQLTVALIDANPPQYDAAIREADRTLAILEGPAPEQQTPPPYSDTAYCYRAKGDSLGEGNGDWWYRKALAALLRGEQVDAAATELMREANLAHGKTAFLRSWAPLYLELGRVYLRLKEPDKALEALATGRARRPDADFSEEMARAWLAKRDWQHATVSLMEGLLFDPGASRLAAELLEVYRREAQQTCAAGSGASINMQCPLVHDALCEASRNVALEYRRTGQPSKTTATVRTAIQSLGCPAAQFR